VPRSLGKAAEKIQKERGEAVVLVVRVFSSLFFVRMLFTHSFRRSTTRSSLRRNRRLLCVFPSSSPLDSRSFASRSFQPHLFDASSSTWEPSPTSLLTLSDPSSPSKALEQIKTGRQASLGDFDGHLEDPRVDWLRNAAVAI
jgi:hypothetical protein